MIIPIIIIVAIIAAAIIGYFVYAANRKKHTGELKGRFGPEYDRTVAASGRKQAERDLEERQKRVQKLDIRQLGDTQRQDYGERWRVVQVRFVDDPQTSVRDADRLVGNVMTARGYPMATWDQRAADVSVDHPQVVANYRAGHDISQSMEAGKATTEQLRQAMVHYRTLFEELLAPEAVAARRHTVGAPNALIAPKTGTFQRHVANEAAQSISLAFIGTRKPSAESAVPHQADCETQSARRGPVPTCPLPEDTGVPGVSPCLSSWGGVGRASTTVDKTKRPPSSQGGLFHRQMNGGRRRGIEPLVQKKANPNILQAYPTI